MLKDTRTIRLGLAVLGLALVVSLSTATTAWADFVRGGTLVWGGESAVVQKWVFNLDDNGASNDWNPGNGGGSPSYTTRLRINAVPTRHSVTLSGNGDAWNALSTGNNGGSYALAFGSESGNFFYGMGVTVEGRFGNEVKFVQLSSATGSYFYGFNGIFGELDSGMEWELTFKWDKPITTSYTLYLLKQWEEGDEQKGYSRFSEESGADTPEPTTLAILGLGLVGLGWTRWRRKI